MGIGQRPVNSTISYAEKVTAFEGADATVLANMDELRELKHKQRSALDEARTTLGNLNNNHRNLVENLLNYTASPYFRRLKDDANGEAEALSWVDWLNNAEDGASDEQLINFLQWQQHYIESLAGDPDILAEVDDLKRQYRAGLAQGRAEGWLTERKGEAYDQQIDTVSVRLGDAFHTTILGRGGYKEIDVKGRVTVAAESSRVDAVFNTIRNLRHALKHELNHDILQDFERDDAAWHYEAVTEFIALAMDRGYIDSFQPGGYEDDGYVGAYEGPRRLMDTVLTAGSSVLPASLVTRAYSGGELENAQLKEAIDESWGTSDALKRISMRVIVVTAELQSHNPDSNWTELMCTATERVREALRINSKKVLAGNYELAF